MTCNRYENKKAIVLKQWTFACIFSYCISQKGNFHPSRKVRAFGIFESYFPKLIVNPQNKMCPI